MSATPARPSAPMASNPNTPTGSWRHPAMDAITKRKSETSFTSQSFYRVSHNAAALIFTFLLVGFFSHSQTATDTVHRLCPSFLLRWSSWALWSFRLLFLFNICESLLRLFRVEDECADIPLTPGQRKLLGLNPDTPLSENVKASDFVTPPRYQKATPGGSVSAGGALPFAGSPGVSRKLVFEGVEEKKEVTGSPLRMGPVKTAWGSAGQSPKTTGGSLVPSNRWAYDKNILQRRSEGTDVRFSPSKNPFGSPRSPY